MRYVSIPKQDINTATPVQQKNHFQKLVQKRGHPHQPPRKNDAAPGAHFPKHFSTLYIFGTLSSKKCKRSSVGQGKGLLFGKLFVCLFFSPIHVNRSPEWWQLQGMKDFRNDRRSPAFLRLGSSGKCVIISEFPQVPLFDIMCWHVDGTAPDMKCKSGVLPCRWGGG